MREDCAAFARHWQAHNDRVLASDGPLWVVFGDSTAQGLGASSPDGGYVGQVLTELRQRTGLPWRVLNLSVSGALTRDVIGTQLPRLPAHADLVTCGIGVNDILYTSPGKLFADLRALIAAVPDQTVLLDLPLPAGCWGFLGRASVPYVTRINRTIHQAAAARGLSVAEVSAHFRPPWTGKFASDCFHPSQAATATGPAPCWPPWQAGPPVRPKDLSPERTRCLWTAPSVVLHVVSHQRQRQVHVRERRSGGSSRMPGHGVVANRSPYAVRTFAPRPTGITSNGGSGRSAHGAGHDDARDWRG